MLNGFIILIYTCFICIYEKCFRVRVHENGHKRESIKTGKELKLSNTNVIIRYNSNKSKRHTYTDVYRYLTDNRKNLKIQKLIKRNLRAGFITECYVMLLMTVIFSILSHYTLPVSVAYFIYTLTQYLKGEDHRCAKDPANWVYDPSTEP